MRTGPEALPDHRRAGGAQRTDGTRSAPGQTAAELAALRGADPTVVERIWELPVNVTAYDAAYLAVAEALDIPLVTGDACLPRVTGVKRAVPLVP